LAFTTASDNASDPAYLDGWKTGDDGGVGFGPWELAFSGEPPTMLPRDPQFIDNGPLPGNSLGAPAFAMTTGDQPGLFETSEARRTFDAPISVGQTFCADVDGSALDPLKPPNSTGNTFDFYGRNGIERFSLLTNNQYNNDHWTVTGGIDTGIAAGSSFHIDFTLVTANTYDLVLSPVVGGDPLFSQMGARLTGTAGMGIDNIRITAYGTGSSAAEDDDGSKELFFNNLAIIGLAGDYNKDSVVDATDYVMWRKTDSSNLQGYTDWRANFGEGMGGGAAGASPFHTGVPEPATLVLLMFAAAGWCLRRERAA
jgi:hypothetical protein